MANLNLAVIGNCSYGALMDARARIVWACVPRFDGDPVFCSLLAGDAAERAGFYDIELLDFAHSEQRYVDHTAIVITTLHDRHGSAFEIIDFAPRFAQYGRTFRPTMRGSAFACARHTTTAPAGRR
jgi:hypothetical protein